MGRRLTTTRLAAIAAVVIAAVASGCNTTGCIDNRSSMPKAGFYSYTTLEPITLTMVSIGGVDAPDDSLMLSKGSAESVYMPFRIDADATDYFIRYEAEGMNDPSMFDTLRFEYERIPYFASEECGVMFKYDVTSLRHTTHYIDSVAMPDHVIDNTDRINIEIYFRTATPEEPAS